MLHCADRSFYVGHTDNLDVRMAQHQSGLIAGFTRDHLPVGLVWSQDFSTRVEALEAERRIKGWSRAKKLALIRGDWGMISTLAKGKDNPSTSSGQTVGGGTSSATKAVRAEPVEALPLICHPDTPPSCVSAVHVELIGSAPFDELMLRFSIFDGQDVVVPVPASPGRTDGLWNTTCFELFVKPCGSTSYVEFNASPSGQWAAYNFDDYREGMKDQSLAVAPNIESVEETGKTLCYDVDVDFSEIPPGAVHLALSAVIEETGGTKSYWALAHPPGAPDFHHPDCFVLTLPAATQP